MNSQKTDNYSPSQQDCMYTVPDLYSSVDYYSSSTSSSTTSSTTSPATSPAPSNPSTSSVLNTLEPELIQSNVKGSTTTTTTTAAAAAAAASVPPKKQYQCLDCLKWFSRPSALQTHSYTHTSEKPFQCTKPGCGRKFSVVSNLRRHFKVHQKTTVSNKLSSEDRLRYVRQLIRTSEIILARQKEAEEEAQRSLAGRSVYDNENQQRSCSVIHLPQPVSSNYQYQHYFVVPKIDNITCNLTSMESHARAATRPSTAAAAAAAATTTTTMTRHETNYLTGSVIGLPYSWDHVGQSMSVYNLNPHRSNQQNSHFGPGFGNSTLDPNKQNNTSTYFYS